MNKPKISIILPSINPEKWILIYSQIKKSVGKHGFEVIACGPFFSPKELENCSNFKYIRDFGCVSRAFQLGASIANGEFVILLPDDCIVMDGSIGQTIDFFSTKTTKDGITILYSEGQNYQGNQHLDPNYWISGTHKDLNLKHIQKDWKIAPSFMYNLDYFREIGGLDCKFEHTNMNTHDLAYRIQNAGGNIYLSPCRVFASDWKPWGIPKSPIQSAYEENDAPLFKKIYDGEENPVTRKVNFDNWRNADHVWKRRFTT